MAATPKRHVIVGAGTAAINAIRTLRQLGDKGEIHLVSKEPPYSRMVLPYYLDQSISEARTTTATPRQLMEWQVTPKFGRQAVALDTKAAKLKLDNDEEIEYDDLLIATGSTALRPPISGADDPTLFNFWTLADAKGVNRYINPQGRAVMVGAGFIAFTILDGMMHRSGSLSIVEAEPRILPRMVDETGARIVHNWLESKGVELLTGARLTGVGQNGGRHVLSFAGREDLEADAVVFATGISPNLEWLNGSGIEINQAIVVDDNLKSSAPNVYAAGDVAEGKNLVTGKKEVHAIETTAMEHGRVVGANMAGKKVKYPGSVLMNIVGVAGLNVASFGSWDDADAEVIAKADEGRSAYRKYLFKKGKMVGAIMTSPHRETWNGNDLGMIKGLVQSGVSLGQWMDFLREHPFSIKKAYLATRTVKLLLPQTVLGSPTPAPRS